jgi:hypothetical protein
VTHKNEFLGENRSQLQADLEKIFGSADASAAEDIFRPPFGPTPNCYSIHNLVTMFRWGANERDRVHLAECESCARWVQKYAERPGTFGMRAPALTHRGFRLRDLFRSPVPQPQPALALLYPLQQEWSLGGPGVLNAPVEFALLTDPPDKMEIDVRSLKLEGGLIAEGAKLVTKVVKSKQYSVISFEHVHLAKPLAADISQHVAVTESVQVSGHLAGQSGSTFSGNAYIRLVRDSSYLR